MTDKGACDGFLEWKKEAKVGGGSESGEARGKMRRSKASWWMVEGGSNSALGKLNLEWNAVQILCHLQGCAGAI